MTTNNVHKNLVKFSCVAFELCKQTDRWTDILITLLDMPPDGKVNIIQISWESKPGWPTTTTNQPQQLPKQF